MLVFVCITNISYGQQQASAFDRATYYKAMEGNNSEAIKYQIDIIEKDDFKNKDAFSGALIMKSAGLMKVISKKLKTFKTGKIKFETALGKDSNNAELRFLRLIIQENAPKMLGYNHDLNTDRDFIIAHFNTIPEYTRKVIRNYSKNSKILSVSDF
ncbi:MAG: hypothetical protein JST63_11225 [Bacteroidetes bacterium]|nr:hypothetical protein [Bacteroidota bacterium]